MPKCKILRDVPPSKLSKVVADYEAAGYAVTTQEQGDGNYTVVACKDVPGESAAPDGARALARAADATATAAMPADTLRLLCVHGVGHQEADPGFQRAWVNAITAGLPGVPLEIEFVDYDQIFANVDMSSVDLTEALFRLSASGLMHNVGDLFHRSRGFSDVSDTLSWTAGMVAKWAEKPNSSLREQTRSAVQRHITAFNPHAVLAHSLGSLICYDLFQKNPTALVMNGDKAGRVFVSLGSQIGNPFVRDQFGGRIDLLKNVDRWFHLFNPHDDAFTAKIRLSNGKFQQLITEFDIDGVLDHEATEYLGHPNTANVVWPYLNQKITGAARGLRKDGVRIASRLATMLAEKKVSAIVQPKPQNRALLIGINDYPDPENRLEGCVNDVFLMSAVLQECGFRPEEIRVVLNDRATASGVLERLEWLLDGADDGQNRVLFYSGHGAQIPGYGANGEPDRLDECLVPYDFDWSREHAVVDNQFYELYSQLPEDARFLAILDCCHSGGMTRDGSARVRGLNPPDDIRHRALRWNPQLEMWESRLEGFEGGKGLSSDASSRSSDVCRLGRRSRATARAYQPILLEACREKQFSYEYRHGVTSYGAFTYSLAQVFRQARKDVAAGKRKDLPKWGELVGAVTKRLHNLHYHQTPVLECPADVKGEVISWKPKK